MYAVFPELYHELSPSGSSSSSSYCTTGIIIQFMVVGAEQVYDILHDMFYDTVYDKTSTTCD